MIAALLPDGVAAVEAFDDSVPAELFPAEQQYVARAVDKRRREFATARRCAREALAVLGHPPAPLLPGRRGAPVWPDGVVGSITHCDGYRTAAVAVASHLRAIGIDAEPDAPLPAGVLPAVALPAELAAVRRLTDENPGLHWDRLLFSAKESVYKAWFPLTGRWLNFDEAQISFCPGRRTFEARLLVDDPGPAPATFAGRYAAAGGLLLTAITVGAG